MGVVRILFAAAAVMLAACGVRGGETRCATGLLTPPRPRHAVKNPSAAPSRKTKALLSAANPLPAKWDSREHFTNGVSWIGPVKNQNPYETCWAFASCATLETQLRRLGKGEWDFSEKNMVNLSGYDNLLNFGVLAGYNDLAEAYLLRWGGAVAETNDVYTGEAETDEWKRDSIPMNPPIHVQNVVWVPARITAYDNDTLKQAIMVYGAVAVSMAYYTTYLNENVKGAYYCYYDKAYVNHAVTVIGWDDEYSKTNFVGRTPTANGAWLVKNSHGEDSGDGGYLYVSYFDKRFFMDNSSLEGTVYIPAADDEDYTAVYCYDRLGPSAYGLDGDGCPISAIFTSVCNEELAAIGLYVCIAPLEYSFSVYTNVVENANSPTNGVLACTQYGMIEEMGFHTIHLETPIGLSPNCNYSIVFKNEQQCDKYFAVCTDITLTAGNVDIPIVPDKIPGKTFFQPNTGEWLDSTRNSAYLTWDSYKASGNICLKAYTRSVRQARDGGAGEAADGTEMCAELAAANPALYAQTAQTFGAFANIVCGNGRTLWGSWLAGLDIADPSAEDDFTLSITVTNGVPYLSWTPDLGSRRTYSVYSAQSLEKGGWELMKKGETAGFRFFRVEVSK